MNAEAIAAALGGRRRGDGWIAHCPAHDDDNPSLSIANGERGIVVRCRANCEQQEVISALRDRGLWPAPTLAGDLPRFQRRSVPTTQAIVKTTRPPASEAAPECIDARLGKPSNVYKYSDENGLIFCIARYEIPNGKTMRPWSWVEARWQEKAYRGPRALYNLRALVANPNADVLIIEGEKCCDYAIGLNLECVPTTWAGGTNAWHLTDWSALAGRRIILFPDNDEPGRHTARAIANKLLEFDCSVRVIEYAHLGYPNGWDIADSGFDRDAFNQWARPLFRQRAAASAVLPEPMTDTAKPRIELRCATDIMFAPQHSDWLLDGLLEGNAMGVLFGDFGTYKSFLAIDWALSIATGRSWNSFECDESRDVVYLHAEGRGLGRRLRAWCQDRNVKPADLRFHAVEHILSLDQNEIVAGLQEAIDSKGIKPALIVVDTLSRNAGALDENSTQDMAGFINTLDAELRIRYGATVLLVHHVGHLNKNRARGSYAILANTDTNWLVERTPGEPTVVTVTTGRMKDSEPPAPILLEPRVIDLGTMDHKGRPEASVVLSLSQQIFTPVTRRRPTAKAQLQILERLETDQDAKPDRPLIWTIADMRAIGRDLGQDKSNARRAVDKIIADGFLVPTIGGHRLACLPKQESL